MIVAKRAPKQLLGKRKRLFWKPCGGLWRHPEASGGRLGAMLELCCARLEPFGEVLEPAWAVSDGYVGAILAILGPSWSCLGPTRSQPARVTESRGQGGAEDPPDARWVDCALFSARVL